MLRGGCATGRGGSGAGAGPAWSGCRASALSVDKFRQNLILREAELCVPAIKRLGGSWIGESSYAKRFVVKPSDLRGGAAC